MASVFDQTAYERERSALPRFIARPPKGDKTDWEHEHAWELVYDWSVAKYLDKSWECRGIACDDAIDRAPTIDEGRQRQRDRQARLREWADEFLATGRLAAVTPSDREDTVRIAINRLREISADGFLVRALEASR